MRTDDLAVLLGQSGFIKGFFKNGVFHEYLPDDCFFCISGITHDSRRIKPGNIFACLRGAKNNGHNYASEAENRGACAILSEEPTGSDLLHFLVKDTREVIGLAASRIYEEPALSLKMIAVTGTNGKSTTAFMLRSIFCQAGIKQGLIGTIIYDDGSGVNIEAERTTPEVTCIQELLSVMLKNGCKSCVMETSSHGLSQGRLAGSAFDAAVFTNLTPEHLDFHGSMENYFNSKMKLFYEYMKPGIWTGSANIDDLYGSKVRSCFPDRIQSFGLAGSSDADFSGTLKKMDLSGIRLEIHCRNNGIVIPVDLPLTGAFNAQNALGAASVSLGMGIDPEAVKRGLEDMPQVPGRLQKISYTNGVTVLIDYAHTPDALKNLLSAVRGVCKGRIWSVFGLGGDRFQQNRPIMGEIASGIADYIVITMDNPRSEDPCKIAEQIVDGIKSGKSSMKADWRIILDRKEAVNFALDSAGEGDAVVVSGKGPEKNIVFSDRVVPYSDLEAVEGWSRSRGVMPL